MKIPILFLCASVAIAEDLIWREFEEINNDFSLNFYKQSIDTSKTNFGLSPLSAAINLILANFGSKGKTREEVLTALSIPQSSLFLQQSISSLLRRLTDSENYNLNITNKIYVNNKFQVTSDFKAAVKNVYSAEIEEISFTDGKKAANIINNWFHDKIKEGIEDIVIWDYLNNVTTSLVLLNGLHLKAHWSVPFTSKLTVSKDFYITPTETVSVKTLHSSPGQKFLIGEDFILDAKILQLPFVGNEASLTIVLPNKKDGLEDSKSYLKRALQARFFSYATVEVAIPKFKIESIINLEHIFHKLGVYFIFNFFDADLSGVAEESRNLYVSDFIQSTLLEVNEHGIGINSTQVSSHPEEESPASRKFIADHPFYFYIKIKEVIAFVGRITDPSV